MWHELLQIKTTREQQARSALVRCRAEQALARQRWVAADECLRRHRHLAGEQDRTLFGALLQRQVRLRDIEAVQQTLALLKIRDHQLDLECSRAEAAHAEAGRHAANALDVQRGASRMKEKFAQMAMHHRADHDQGLQRFDELEQEEVGALCALHDRAHRWDSA